MPFSKHGALWVVLTLLGGMLTGCTRGPVDPIPQYGDISGYVRTSISKKAIEGATVTCAGQTYKVTRSGIYIFKEIPEGYHTLKAEKTGYRIYTTMIRVTDNTVHNVYMDKIVEYRDIAGHVYLDDSSIPVAGVTVVCGDVWDTTAADGCFLLEDVLAATHSLFAFKNHYVSYEARISLESDTTVEIYLASAPLTGVLRHRLDGAVNGARVDCAGVSVYSASDGCYRLPTAPQGTHRVVISHPYYDSLVHTITIKAGENRLDTIMTRSICDSIPITEDASITESDLEGCPDCPTWGDVCDNYGQSEMLRLEYFLRVDVNPPRATHAARTRVLISLPPLPENAGRNSMTGVRLVLFPVDDSQSEQYVSFRSVKGGGDSWSEDSVTWANRPETSPLLFAAEAAVPEQPLVVEVIPLYDNANARPSLLLQGEEVGEVDPPRRLIFHSSETVDETLRPVLVVKYSF